MRDDLLFEGDNLLVSKTLKQIDSNVCYKKRKSNIINKKFTRIKQGKK
jgi:hypothetical protein